MESIARFFAGPRGPLRLATLALLWSLPALGVGLQSDDHLMRWAVLSGAPAWDLFHFDAAFLASRRESGFFPWWTSPSFDVVFFRPLSSLLHTLEYRLYPEWPALMLAVNVLLYGALVWLAAKLYQRLLPTAELAALAGLMFALDEGHGPSVGWIAGRNTLLAALFSLLALHFYLRGVDASLTRGKSAPLDRRYAALSTLSVALALLSAEAGLCSVLLLIAVVAREPGLRLRDRLRALAPQLTVAALWRALYLHGGYGAHGSSWYRDVGAAPQALGQTLADLPLWLVGLFGPASMSLSVFYPTAVARLVALPVAVLLVVLLLPALRGSRTEHAGASTSDAHAEKDRATTLGLRAEAARPATHSAPAGQLMGLLALLCLAPVVFTVPSARVLLGASFGGFGLLALAVASTETTTARALWTRRLFLGLHVWAALLLFPVALRSTHALEGAVQRLAGAATSSEVVLIRSPLELLPSYALCLEDDDCGDEQKSGRSLHQLYSGGSELWVERTAERELTLTATRGWGDTPAEGVYCARDQLPGQGAERSVGRLHARVLTTTDDARPLRVRFTFPTTLESEQRTFLSWQGTRPVRWQPPPVGQRVRLAPLAVARSFEP